MHSLDRFPSYSARYMDILMLWLLSGTSGRTRIWQYAAHRWPARLPILYQAPQCCDARLAMSAQLCSRSLPVEQDVGRGSWICVDGCACFSGFIPHGQRRTAEGGERP